MMRNYQISKRLEISDFNKISKGLYEVSKSCGPLVRNKERFDSMVKVSEDYKFSVVELYTFTPICARSIHVEQTWCPRLHILRAGISKHYKKPLLAWMHQSRGRRSSADRLVCCAEHVRDGTRDHLAMVSYYHSHYSHSKAIPDT